MTLLNFAGKHDRIRRKLRNVRRNEAHAGYGNARIYADERWEMYLTFRVEYSVEHHAWLSRVVVRSLLDNASNEVMVADNADATMLVSKLKIKKNIANIRLDT